MRAFPPLRHNFDEFARSVRRSSGHGARGRGRPQEASQAHSLAAGRRPRRRDRSGTVSALAGGSRRGQVPRGQLRAPQGGGPRLLQTAADGGRPSTAARRQEHAYSIAPRPRRTTLGSSTAWMNTLAFTPRNGLTAPVGRGFSLRLRRECAAAELTARDAVTAAEGASRGAAVPEAATMS